MWSARTQAIIASPTGTALIPTQGSCLPFVTTSTSEPNLSIDFRGDRIELVGLTANLTTIGSPVVIPPRIPPAVFVRNPGYPLIIRISTDASLPGVDTISNPSPISTAFTAFIDIIALAKSLSILP